MSTLSLALAVFLTAPTSAAPSSVGAELDSVSLDEAGLARDCDAGATDSCLKLARGLTGVGLPVDLLAARSAYEKACRLGEQQGCIGATGLSRHIGRHVELAFMSSVPRVWALSGPGRVTGPDGLEAAEDPLAAAILQRLPFAEICYGNALEVDAQLEGLVDLSLIVAGDRISDAVVHQASLPGEAAEDALRCMVQALTEARLPTGTADGEVFLRLRAEPGPAASTKVPVVQDHLADGAQATIGDPASQPTDRRVEVAMTVAARRALGGTRCVLNELEAGRWQPVALGITAVVPPDGAVASLRVSADPIGRQQLADCVGQQLQGLAVGQTGLPQDVAVSLVMRVGPAWTATIVP